jgi:hypothetical protein
VPDEINIDEHHPANAGVLKYLREGLKSSVSSAAKVFSCSPQATDQPYLTLGTHPDLVERLWDKITVELPVSCKWIVLGRPVLVRPNSGVIFGLAIGTCPYVLRLPPEARRQMAAAVLAKAMANADRFDLSGAKRETYLTTHTGDTWTYHDGSLFDARALGPEWILGRWLDEEIHLCREGYEFAV